MTSQAHITEQNLRIVQDMYAAFPRGDFAFILGCFADQQEEFGVLSSTNTGVPWHIEGRTKADVARYFELLGGTIEMQVFEVSDYAAMGEHVYATLHMEAVVRATAMRFNFGEVIHHFTLRGGKVVRWRGSEDTALTANLFR
jgi:ketosteroid isomerase-like protein